MPKGLNFHPIVWFILGGTILARGAFFMSMPFLAIYLHGEGKASVAIIGLVIGLSPITGTLASFYIGHLSDKIGRRNIMNISLLIWSFVFFGFSVSTEIWQFALLNVLNGLCRSSFEPVSKALLSDICEKEQFEKAIHLRYFAINLGASLGPLTGTYFMVDSPGIGFRITAFVYILYAIILKLALHAFRVPKITAEIHDKSFKQIIKVLTGDRVLRWFLISATIVAIVYSQMDTTLPIFLKDIFNLQGVKYFGWLIATNAATVVALQYPLVQSTKKYNPIFVAGTGALMIGLGTLGFAVSGGFVFGYFVSMVFFTIGEVLCFTNGNIIIDRLAPSRLKGVYFGAANLAGIGFMLGPVIGGSIFEHIGKAMCFSTIGTLGFIGFATYLRGYFVNKHP